jgi:Tfp pilus assembly protein PilF
MDQEARRHQAEDDFGQAYRLQMNGELSRAVALYKQSIATHPTAEAHTFLGWTYSQQGRLDDAIEECREAIRVDPSFGNPYNDIGAYLMQRGDIDEAIDWFHQALRAPRYESYCFPHVNLGRVYEGKRMWVRALGEYRRAVRENSDYKPALEGIARIRGLLN